VKHLSGEAEAPVKAVLLRQELQFGPAGTVADHEEAGCGSTQSYGLDQQGHIPSRQQVPDVTNHRSRQSNCRPVLGLPLGGEDGGVHAQRQMGRRAGITLSAKHVCMTLADGKGVVNSRQDPAFDRRERWGEPLVDVLGSEERELRLWKMAASELHNLISAQIPGLAQDVDDIRAGVRKQGAEATAEDLGTCVASVVKVGWQRFHLVRT